MTEKRDTTVLHGHHAMYLSARWTQAIFIGSDAMPTESAYLHSAQDKNYVHLQ